MARSKIILLLVLLLSTLSIAFKFKVSRRSFIAYFTTTSYNAIATMTLTMAITTAAGTGAYRYYTLLDNQRATNHSYIIKLTIEE